MYKFGKIVLIPFPFTDFSSQKLRPALIISKNNVNTKDIVALFITSKKSNNSLSYYLPSTDPLLKNTGLKVDSYLRCDKIVTIDKQLVFGELGALHQTILKKVGKVFFNVFGF